MSRAVTSTMFGSPRCRPHSAAADAWLSAASGPHARTAAIHRPLRPQNGVADRVHPTVDRMQPAERDTVLDRARRQTELGELLAPDDPVLAASALRDRAIHRGWADLPTYVVGNSAHPPSLAPNASQRTPETQQFSATRGRTRTRAPTPLRCGRSGAAASAGRPAGYRARPWEASSSAWPLPARRTRRRAW